MKNLSTDELLKMATARPWKATGPDNAAHKFHQVIGGDLQVCVTHLPADAELIARAVNSFEAMKAAAIRALKAIENHGDSREGNAAWHDLLNALALSEGKESAVAK